MSDLLVLGSRADGRPVFLIRGGADGDGGASAGGGAGGEGALSPASAGAAGEPAKPDGAQPGAGDSGDDVEFNEENFNKLIADINKLNADRERESAEREAEREDWRSKVHRASQDASRYRQQARTLAGLVGDGATGKPGPKPKASAKPDEAPAGTESDARLAELSQQLEAARRSSLLSAARAGLAEAGVPKSAIARAVRMVDLSVLEMGDAGEIAGLDEQIAALKEDVPQLFAPPATTTPTPPVANGAGAAGGARVIRAAAAVAGKGAAGRTGGAPEPLTSTDVLVNRALGRPDDYRG